ncbi:hypothetical protein C1645_820292 [Glomus cerebriforme]|uniref:Uncharacterized protein n=1 Tax=Glomus cerebriforme TaxID=658196 RepID=A0A397T738_9GLOM|nr:hypothetical protein C1645_820292 [Glomus cerebriforme]
MSKTSKKQKSRNSRLNNETRNNSNNVFVDRPSFPPTITLDDLIRNKNSNNRPRAIPNAFIVYRMALIREYRIINHKLPPMSELSKIAKKSWDTELKHVRDHYELLVNEAKSIYKQNNVQIVLDKHMNYIENNEDGTEARQLESTNEDLTIQNSAVIVNSHNNNVSSSVSSANYSIIDSNSSHEANSTYNSREEYIKVLEETIEYLLRD